MEVNLDLDPARRSFRTDGSYLLVNRSDKPLPRVPLTGGFHWEEITWTMDGATYKPEDRTRLFVFTPPTPLAPGDTLRIGFTYHGRYPKGITKNGGGAPEFILPSGVVLTSFRPSFVPVLGYMEEIGVEKENRMGREPMLAGCRHFIEMYKDGPDYPVLQDFTREMRPFAPDTTAYDAFVQQWFFEVKMPEYRLDGAQRAEGGAGSWSASARLRNTGAGTMPVEVAAVAGERFAKDGSASPDYREARVTVEPGAGEEREVVIACGFKPERLVVDPDALVLQLRRKAAVAGL